MTTVLKLGGSVITDKESPETVDETQLQAVATAVGEAVDAGEGNDLILVHGGGSFGHHHAAAHDVSATHGTHETAAIREIHNAMKTLNAAVVDALADQDVPVLPVHPLSCASRDSNGKLTLPAEHIATMLSEGVVPVVHGDVIAHKGNGATVLSGDDIVVSLAESLDAERVGLCSTVPGVLDADDAVIPEITAFEDVAAVLGASEATDVTGGMAGKVRTLLSLDAPASIFAAGDVPAFLAGERPGTLVHAPS